MPPVATVVPVRKPEAPASGQGMRTSTGITPFRAVQTATPEESIAAESPPLHPPSEEVEERSSSQATQPVELDEDGRATLNVDDQPRDLVEQARTALRTHPAGRNLYNYGGAYAEVRDDGSATGTKIRPLGPEEVRMRLIQVANWVKGVGGAFLPKWPPPQLVSLVCRLIDPRTPKLHGLMQAPGYGPQHRLLQEAGYDASEGVLLALDSDLSVDEVPDSPSEAEVAAARMLLIDDLLLDFPFASQSDRCHAVAVLLLPFFRFYLGAAPTPLHLIQSPTPGTSKTLLANVTSIVATGDVCRVTNVSSGGSELRKKLTAVLAEDRAIVLLDNLPQDRRLDSDALASLLTSAIWTDRMLGTSTMLTLPNTAVWLMTANNPRLSTELLRRSIRIHMDAGQDRPWERTGFLHPDLLAWVRAQRGRLVHACLVLIQNWIAKGRPDWEGQTVGSFERWTKTMGGILAAADIPGFLDNLDDMYREADQESEEWRTLSEVWWATHGSTLVKASQVVELCIQHELLDEVIGGGGLRSQRARLGRALSAHEGRVFGTYRICRDTGARRNSGRYYLQQQPVASATEVAS